MREFTDRNSKIKRVLAPLILAVLLLSVIIAFTDHEPSYQNHSLRSWLQQYSDASLEETQRLAEAQEAVQSIGVKQAMPEMLKLLKAKDGAIKQWVLSKTERFNNRHLQWKSASELRQYAIAGFEMLGTNCASAAGELGALLNDKEIAFDAARCLDQIGKAAEPALCQCLTNQDWQVRNLGVSALASVTDDVEVYLARIKAGSKILPQKCVSALSRRLGRKIQRQNWRFRCSSGHWRIRIMACSGRCAMRLPIY